MNWAICPLAGKVIDVDITGVPSSFVNSRFNVFGLSDEFTIATLLLTHAGSAEVSTYIR
jgi:hypothetical protein